MKSVRSATSAGSSRWRSVQEFRGLAVLVVQCLLIATMSLGLAWLVWIYESALRDPRYLDGWILAGGMIVQLYLHVARKSRRLSPRSDAHWRKFHIFVGYLLIAAFVLHVDFSLPDTAFEWALWTGFVLVTLSGLFGTYISVLLRNTGRIDESIGYERIADRRAELASKLRAIVLGPDPGVDSVPLPSLPHNEWIIDLHTNRLQDFFRGQRNYTAHLLGWSLATERLKGEIDALSRYVDEQGQAKLAAVKELVIEKDRLDFAHVFLGLSRAWLFVHVPLTYTLVVMSGLHILIAYAYSSGGG